MLKSPNRFFEFIFAIFIIILALALVFLDLFEYSFIVALIGILTLLIFVGQRGRRYAASNLRAMRKEFRQIIQRIDENDYNQIISKVDDLHNSPNIQAVTTDIKSIQEQINDVRTFLSHHESSRARAAVASNKKAQQVSERIARLESSVTQISKKDSLNENNLKNFQREITRLENHLAVLADSIEFELRRIKGDVPVDFRDYDFESNLENNDHSNL